MSEVDKNLAIMAFSRLRCLWGICKSFVQFLNFQVIVGNDHLSLYFGHKEGMSAEELMLSNCGAGKDSSESLGLQGDQTSQSQRKSVLNIHWKD